MRCPHCKSLMTETAKTLYQRSEEVHYECGLCRRIVVTFRPVAAGGGETRLLGPGSALRHALLEH